MLSSPIASRMDGVSCYAREKGCCARVSADHVSAGRLAVAHLAERNYRSRVFFTLDWDGNVRNRIWRGFTESGPAEKWVFSRECPNVRWDDWNAVGRWLAGKFAAADKPLGVLAYSQGEAVLLMDAALWDRVSETYLRNSGKYSLVGGGAVRGRCVAAGCRGVASHPRHPRRR